MAHNQDSTAGATTIARVGKRKKGYDVRQVDAFLEQAHALYEGEGLQLKRSDIQDASFDIVKGGYAIPQVDATLERLEQAVTDKRTSYEIGELGRVAWKAQTETRFHQLEAHAARAAGERFAPGEAKKPSYDRKQVDRIVERIIDKARVELQQVNADDLDDGAKDPDPSLTAQAVADMTFTQRRGRRGYDERQVDYYLNACVDLLGSLESYARIADFANPAAYGAARADDAPAPLIAADLQAPSARPAPVATDVDAAATDVIAVTDAPLAADRADGQSFDELHRAEQAIFAASSAQRPAAIPPAGRGRDDDDPAATAVFDAPAAPASPAATSAPEGPVASDVRHARTLSDIAPITPAPRTIPEYERAAQRRPADPQPAPAADEPAAPIADHTVVDLDSPSLASLAQPAPAGAADEPQELSVPKLTSMTLPDLPPLPMPSTSGVRPADPPATGSDERSSFGSSSAASRFERERGFDMEIPDLAFPTFSTDGPLVADDGSDKGEKRS